MQPPLIFPPSSETPSAPSPVVCSLLEHVALCRVPTAQYRTWHLVEAEHRFVDLKCVHICDWFCEITCISLQTKGGVLSIFVSVGPCNFVCGLGPHTQLNFQIFMNVSLWPPGCAVSLCLCTPGLLCVCPGTSMCVPHGTRGQCAVQVGWLPVYSLPVCLRRWGVAGGIWAVPGRKASTTLGTDWRGFL